MGLSTISRAKRDQTWREDVVTNGIGRVEGITVDWIAGLDIILSDFIFISKEKKTGCKDCISTNCCLIQSRAPTSNHFCS